MAIRIKSRWKSSDTPKSVEDNAQALAFIAWRLALDKAINLHGEDFVYDSDDQRVSVIAEYLAFEIQVADRLAFGRLDDGERERFVNTLALRLADHIQDNLTDLFGPDDYRQPFIDRLNARLEDYAGLAFEDDKPGYGFLRYLGERVLSIMGRDQTNRWTIDQVMDIDGPEVAGKLKNAMFDLFS